MFKKTTDNWLIVGLGNPGTQYEKTRHTCGFRALDILAKNLNCKVDKAKFQGLYGQVNYNGKKLYLLKPQTYMNNSGLAVSEALRFYKLPPENLIVLCDDISFEPGIFRIRRKGSAGGHNGLKSIIEKLGSDNFPRLKIGVGQKPHPDYDLADWVLGHFPENDKATLRARVEVIRSSVLAWLDGDFDAAVRALNGQQEKGKGGLS